jgi:hypothetical protein
MASIKRPVAEIEQLKAKYRQVRSLAKTLSFSNAASEIADALNIKHEAATMMLYGLCATGEVRWWNAEGLIDEDECTVADFGNKPKRVSADDVRHCLGEWSEGPQRSGRRAVISAMIAEGVVPPDTIEWTTFCKRVRDECNGWRAKGKPAWGFGDKQIRRIVTDLRDK